MICHSEQLDTIALGYIVIVRVMTQGKIILLILL